ncbi:MAG TPA: 16S rRNA (uracil(1498)-N(3))-methyltransferase, partial [Myxococcaceae bacterium]|nr:16S rRNA (uracil(1498)-N(3))-methyltransferase [Myxococcaceae bacterium]
MNLVLLEAQDFLADGTVRLAGRRALHLCKVLRVGPGDSVRVGVRGGGTGTGTVLSASLAEANLRVTLTAAPPPRPGVDLVLAMPRPKALKRILSTAAQLGVDRLFLVNAARVEKSFFTSAALEPETVDRLFREGAEQARDTVLPELSIHDRFRPFLEEALDARVGAKALRLLPHPAAERRWAEVTLPVPRPTRAVLAVGPEGGWVPFEVELLKAHGFLPVSLGSRVLRVETAVPYLLGL